MSDGSSKTRPTDEQYAAKFLREGIESRVRRLRALADQLESEAEGDLKRAEAGQRPYAMVVANYANSLSYGVANQHLGTLISTAYDADIAHAKGE